VHPVVSPEVPFAGASSIWMVVRQAAGGSVQHGKMGNALCCAPKLGPPNAEVNRLAVLIGF